MNFNPEILVISLFATSSALLGICVGMLNFTYSTLLSPHIQNNNFVLGDKDYKRILEKNAVIVIFAGLLYWTNSMLSLYMMWSSNDLIIISISLFVIASLLVFISIIHDKFSFKWSFPKNTKPPEIETPKAR